VSGVRLVRHIRAQPHVVTAEGIAQWWGPDAGPVLVAELDSRVGGRYRVRFRRLLDGTEYESSGEFLEVVPHERIAMSWRWTDGVPDPGESRVEITLKAIPEGTELTFVHSNLNNEDTRRGHEEGWTGSLDKLVAYVIRERPV
jgi:uncharacterized protein YndB with AHSA1/START domain